MAKTPKQIVEEVEAALKDSHPCPYCGLYDGTHQVTCEYLKHKGNVEAERMEKPKAREEPKMDSVDSKKLLDQMKPKEK